jgi:hypothetical protein
MVRTRALRFLLILGLIALLIPVGLAQADSHGPSGTAVIRDAVILGDPFAGDTPVTVRSGMLTISLSGLPAPAEGTALEGWLVSDDGARKQSVGILEVSEEGTVSHEFIADPGENLFEAFDKAVITREPSPDTDPGPSMEIVLASGLLEGVLEQVRALHVPGDDDATPFAVGLIEQVGLAAASARQAQAAATNGDLEMARTHTACVMAIIQGSADCGDGVGILTYADNVVVAAAAAQEAAEGADTQDDPAASSSAATVAAATSVRERAEQAAGAAALASAATSTQVATLHLVNVVDHLGGNGAMGFANTAYTSSQDMGSYTLDLPSVGEALLPQMVRYGLIGSITLMLLGSMMAFATRRRSSVSAA